MADIYFDICGGASGDMLLSSLVQLGCDLNYLRAQFEASEIPFEFAVKEISFGHAQIKKVQAVSLTKERYTHFQIKELIEHSQFSEAVKGKVIAAYDKIADIERKVHRVRKKNFDFYHLGEIDAIVEIAGFFLALEYMNIRNIFVSEIPLSHPAPATLEILQGKNVRVLAQPYESITPTAALLLSYARQNLEAFVYQKVAYALGSYGEGDYLLAYLLQSDTENDELLRLQTTLDDMNPQCFELLFEELYSLGAKEVYLEQVVVKKSRPAWVVNILLHEKDLSSINACLFKATSTFGIRYWKVKRSKLRFAFIEKETELGKVRFRVSCSEAVDKCMPEYEDCKNLARKHKISLQQVYQKILASP